MKLTWYQPARSTGYLNWEICLFRRPADRQSALAASTVFWPQRPSWVGCRWICWVLLDLSWWFFYSKLYHWVELKAGILKGVGTSPKTICQQNTPKNMYLVMVLQECLLLTLSPSMEVETYPNLKETILRWDSFSTSMTVGGRVTTLWLGCSPFPGCQWQMKVYRNAPLSVVITVVSVTARLTLPTHNHHFSPKVMTSSAAASLGLLVFWFGQQGVL